LAILSRNYGIFVQETLMKSFKINCVIFSLLLLLAAIECPASIITYAGHDSGAGPASARPNSDAAQASFFSDLAAASVTAYTLDFESIPVQYSNSINLTTMTLFQVGTSNDANAGVTNDTGDRIVGYNTTASGDTFLRIVPEWNIGTAGARLVFNSPVEYFGAYYSGLGTAAGSLTVEFTANSINYAFPVTGGSSGGINYFGFTSFGNPFSEVTMVLRGVTGGTRDIYAIDDITTGLQGTYVPSTVPEPASLLLLGTGLGALVLFRFRRIKN
jgi:hypothetical protein